MAIQKTQKHVGNIYIYIIKGGRQPDSKCRKATRVRVTIPPAASKSSSNHLENSVEIEGDGSTASAPLQQDWALQVPYHESLKLRHCSFDHERTEIIFHSVVKACIFDSASWAEGSPPMTLVTTASWREWQVARRYERLTTSSPPRGAIARLFRGGVIPPPLFSTP